MIRTRALRRPWTPTVYHAIATAAVIGILTLFMQLSRTLQADMAPDVPAEEHAGRIVYRKEHTIIGHISIRPS